jgi:hypothetical protein
MPLPSFLNFDLTGDFTALPPSAAARVLRAYCRALRSAHAMPLEQWLLAAAAGVSMSEGDFRRALADLGILDPDPLRLHGRLRRGRILELRRPFRGLPAGARHLVVGRRLQRMRPRYEVLGPDGSVAWWSAERINLTAALTPSFIVLPPGKLTLGMREAAARALWP